MPSSSYDAPLSAVITRVAKNARESLKGCKSPRCAEVRWCQRSLESGVAHFSSLEYRKTKSATSPALRTPVLRHQAEAQIAICAKPGAHPAHTHENPAYARCKNIYLKSLYCDRKSQLPGWNPCKIFSSTILSDTSLSPLL